MAESDTLPPWELYSQPDTEDADARAISGIESSGRYNLLGPVTRKGDRAYGKYQVMGANIPEWTRDALGAPMTPDQFLADPNAQEAVFAHRFGQYRAKYGPEGAARAWFAGEGGMNDLGRKDQLGTSVAAYGQKFSRLGGGSGEAAPPQQGSARAPDDSRPPWEIYPAEAAPAAAPTPPVGEQGTATAGEALGRGYEKTKGMVGGALEVAGEATGIEGLRTTGESIRKTAAQAVQQYPAQAEFLKIQSASDAAQYAKETLLDFVPQIGAGLAGAVLGGAVGGPAGALVGAGIPSLVMNTGDIQSQLKEKDPNAQAPGYVAAGGTAAAALDMITPFRLGSKLIAKFGMETGEALAKATLARSTAKEIGKSMTVEGTTEALQEVIGEYATSGALDQPPDTASLPSRMVESFAAGATGGAVFGGAAHVISGGAEVQAPHLPELPPWEAFKGGAPVDELGGNWETVPPGVINFTPSETGTPSKLGLEQYDVATQTPAARAQALTVEELPNKDESGTLPGGLNYREVLLSDPNRAEDVSAARIKDRWSADGAQTMFVEGLHGDFTRTSAEAAALKLVQMASDGGYERVSWAPGVDREVASAFERVARLLKAPTGEAYLPTDERPFQLVKPLYDYVNVSDRAVVDNLSQQMTPPVEPVPGKKNGVTFEGEPQQEAKGTAKEEIEKLLDKIQKDLEKDPNAYQPMPAAPAVDWRMGDVADARPELQQMGEFVWKVSRRFGMKKPMQIHFRPGISAGGTMAFVRGYDANNRPVHIFRTEPARFHIELFLGYHQSLEEAYASLTHEVGHALMVEHYAFNASPLLKAQIDEAFERQLAERKAKGVKTYGDLYRVRDNFLVTWFDMRTPPNLRNEPGAPPTPGGRLKDASPGRYEYWNGKEEWFAEQVARWFTTSPKALNAVDRFFKSLGQRLRMLYDAFKAKFGLAEPDSWIKGWLDSLLVQEPTIGPIADANARALAESNARAMRSAGIREYPDTRLDVSSIPGRRLIAAIGESVQARAMAAAGDRFNGFYKWNLSVVQVAARNLHIAPLQRYVELWQRKQLERAQMMNGALDTLKAWRNLGQKQAAGVSLMIDDYMNMRFLSDAEVQQGIERRPTQDEIQKMADAHGVNEKGVEVFNRIRGDFDGMLLKYEALLRAEAQKLSPVEAIKRLAEISAMMARMRNIPYAPAMRFGDLVVLVKDPKGNVVSRYHFEKERTRKAFVKDLEKQLNPGERIELTAVPEQAKPFMGLPPGLLDLIAEKLNLSKVQRETINQLRYEFAPAHGFQHRFQRKHHIKGYSGDFMRAYANYFFHGSNYFTNVKYIQPLRDEVGLVKLSADGLGDGTKRMQIHNFLDEHLNYMLDPKPDFAHVRGAMFHWALGFSPAAAFINLTQLALGSYPFLAGKFGDLYAGPAMLKAGAKLSTFYKRGTLAANMHERDLRALSEGIRQGVITEAMAPELAGLTEQDNLRKWHPGLQHPLVTAFSEYSGFMFQTAEQINRRVTFRAAWQLALDNPNSRYVQEMRKKHSLQFESLVNQGWAENEAAAFVAAKDAVESTQFIYHQWANPRFMRGKLRTVFIFKNFLQNTMFMLWNYPETRVRALLVFAFLGGMMGLPGADDLKGLIKALGWRIFGKDWDVEQEARNLVLDITKGKVSPDLLLHGASRYGFGLPAVMALAGVPFPSMDASRSIGLGRLLPVDPNVPFGQAASKDPGKAALDTVTQLAGYAFQVNSNFYNALVDTQLQADDVQRWTKVMPRALAGLSRSYQALSQGEIRTRTGAAVIKFDTSDSAQMMEALAMAGGFQPTRLSAKWDLIMAQREAIQFWDLKREGLLRELWQARETGDQENYKRVIGAVHKYNDSLPPEARGKAITADAIIKSFETRATSKAKMEVGVPQSIYDIPLVRDIQRLYPEAEVNVRKTR